MQEQEITQLERWIKKAIFSHSASQYEIANDTVKDHYDALYLGYTAKIEQLAKQHEVELLWSKGQFSFAIDGLVFYEPWGLSYYLNNQKGAVL